MNIKQEKEQSIKANQYIIKPINLSLHDITRSTSASPTPKKKKQLWFNDFYSTSYLYFITSLVPPCKEHPALLLTLRNLSESWNHRKASRELIFLRSWPVLICNSVWRLQSFLSKDNGSHLLWDHTWRPAIKIYN